jgi:hypothetical protein
VQEANIFGREKVGIDGLGRGQRATSIAITWLGLSFQVLQLMETNLYDHSDTQVPSKRTFVGTTHVCSGTWGERIKYIKQ